MFAADGAFGTPRWARRRPSQLRWMPSRGSRLGRFAGLFGVNPHDRGTRTSWERDEERETARPADQRHSMRSRFDRFQALFHVGHARPTNISASDEEYARESIDQHDRRTGLRKRVERFERFFHVGHNRATHTATSTFDTTEPRSRGAPPQPQVQHDTAGAPAAALKSLQRRLDEEFNAVA